MIADEIVLTDEDGQELTLKVIEQTRLGGKDYLLAADGDIDAEDTECWIFRDDSEPGNPMSLFVEIEDEDELDAVIGIFQNLVDGIDIIKQEDE
ncbi:MAG: DUF1292 domain-containing protein [Lachnospiraceae bacterium]